MAKMESYLVDLDMDKMNFVFSVKEAYQKGEMDLKEAQELLRTRVTTLKPYEIALAEQKLRAFDADECRKEDIQGMLRLFQGLMDTTRPSLPEEHPIARYYQEVDIVLDMMMEIEDLIQYPVIKNQWYDIYDRLSEYKIHLIRKQNQLYSMLERKGFDRPTTTMWVLDDFVWDEIKEARALLDAGQEDAFIAKQETVIADVRDLCEKEKNVLYPTALALIQEKEFEEMKSGDAEIGYAWLKTDNEIAKESNSDSMILKQDGFKEELQALLGKYGYGINQEMNVATGRLTLEQINLIYQHMPVDISYVDENEIVKFYTDTAHRVFPRSKNVIGRDVKNCHPRKSVSTVEEIIEKFRSGEQDTAEFWIQKPDLFIYIYYVAVRDQAGRFRGVLEMMQDATHIRSLEGSRTLLTWNDENQQMDEMEPVMKEKPQDSEFPVTTESSLDIQSATRLQDLLERYSWLKDELPQINKAFHLLHTPLARVMLSKATVAMMAERSGMTEADLIAALKESILRHTMVK